MALPISDSDKRIVWSATNRGFGEGIYNSDPDGDGRKVDMPLRYPGQYYDKESGLHYNYFRYYDPTVGRYITSDPIGLAGGINTYGYGAGNPIAYVDVFGLDIWLEGSALSLTNWEPPLHQSISIGDPNGKYQSFSFALSPGGSGVYQDINGGGPILRLLKTTRQQDFEALAYIYRHWEKDSQKWYGPTNNCRTYSQEKFEIFQKMFDFGLPYIQPDFYPMEELGW